MKISEGIEMLELTVNMEGNNRTIYPALIWDKETVILTDTGFPGMLQRLRDAVEKSGIVFNDLKMIILTHQDIDHIGGAADIVRELPGVTVCCHEEEKPYIVGEKPPVKLAALEARVDTLPEPMKQMYVRMKAAFENNKPGVDTTFTDGEELPYCGGIRIIHTPGHTPGHICLYLKREKVLIAGDLLNIEDGLLVRADPQINYNTEKSIESLGKLADYDIRKVISYHGGFWKGNADKRIAELAKGQ